MSTTNELVQNVIDVLDSAHSQRAHLSELLNTISEAEHQVKKSASSSRERVQTHFENLQSLVRDALTKRMCQLLTEVNSIEQKSLEPLSQCGDMINQGITVATQVMEEGKSILENDPDTNLEALVKFKDNPQTKNLNSLPEVPCLSEVPCISVELQDSTASQIRSLVGSEGKVLERAPVQILDTEERPGGMLVKWLEVDEDMEISDFCLQFCYGSVASVENSTATFHTVYNGPNTSHLVKNLRTNTKYSFRVSCRHDANSNWRVWSVPHVAITTFPPYQWDSSTEGYSTGLEGKTATRSTGLTRVLYSQSRSYVAGYSISFVVIDTGEKSPMDGIAITVSNDNTDTLKRQGAVFVGTDGTVLIDGQEMKTKLPSIFSKKSVVTIETEALPNGKVRVGVQVEEKEVKFDWQIEKPQSPMNLIGGLHIGEEPAQQFFFAMQFSHEDWKIMVE